MFRSPSTNSAYRPGGSGTDGPIGCTVPTEPIAVFVTLLGALGGSGGGRSEGRATGPLCGGMPITLVTTVGATTLDDDAAAAAAAVFTGAGGASLMQLTGK